MAETMSKVHDSLDELRSLVATTADPAERRGLEAFIKCVAPQLVDGAQLTYLGKIAALVHGDFGIEGSSTAEALDALSAHFDVEIEPV
ncbi:hypothetical protein [Pseudonocardia sp. NPDC046786]|uniref:hypothetical protein n=1 Tax=Pseudonocardia sp. NPDC046786 TaxID=3155471 RepID=UPI00340ECF11